LIEPSQSKASNTTVGHLGVLVLMVMLSVISYFDRTIMGIAGPRIMGEFGLTETKMGGIYSAFLFAYAALMILGGQLSDRYGARVVLGVSGLGATLFTGLTALGGRPGIGTYLGVVPAFWAIRFSMGAFTAPLYPACARMTANWFPLSRRALVWGVIASGAGVGGAFSPILFSWSIRCYGWRASFWLAALLTGILAVLWLRYARDHPPGSLSLDARKNRAAAPHGNKATRWLQLLTNRDLLLLTLGYALVGYFEYIFFYWIYYYCGAIRHWPARQTELYTAAIFLAWTIMTPLGGLVSDALVERYGRRAGRRLVPIAGLTGGAVCLWAGTNISSPVVAGSVLALAIGFASSSDGPFWASAIELGGSDVAAACGILNTGANLGGTIGRVLTPLIASFAGWSPALYFGCAAVMLSVVTWLFVDPTRAESVRLKVIN
jgi:ACS family glucarate transporter-like MFS transporter